MPTYTMSCFILPKTFCDEIAAMIRKFWWGGKKDSTICWEKWDDLCKKKDECGLGFREFEAFNFAMLAKQGWRLMTNLSSFVARVLKGKYFSHTQFLSAKLGSKPSYVWRSVQDGR